MNGLPKPKVLYSGRDYTEFFKQLREGDLVSLKVREINQDTGMPFIGTLEGYVNHMSNGNGSGSFSISPVREDNRSYWESKGAKVTAIPIIDGKVRGHEITLYQILKQ